MENHFIPAYKLFTKTHPHIRILFSCVAAETLVPIIKNSSFALALTIGQEHEYDCSCKCLYAGSLVKLTSKPCNTELDTKTLPQTLLTINTSTAINTAIAVMAKKHKFAYSSSLYSFSSLLKILDTSTMTAFIPDIFAKQCLKHKNIDISKQLIACNVYALYNQNIAKEALAFIDTLQKFMPIKA